ncbi:1-phosphatidylinositol-4-phosphate 5-kinase Its3 [Schizosaccharomyces cryophilus OY26]|uniref:1-phosphatidylinositol-4-phosphate 5-kinase n=1 Tax=Schizosaccharomyces cryophilus (strain OY26 / ATCC MYA-4695 / CBS 11777 / NBRC 106824 / NRRL Y48691) TaxID=653667 RepID=S9X2Y5_SCHCR|nr:1-phosphatidylinositol-4-phosphate 5-kinase Its3 [Schizosaccharomyces cryophilus OY26]EPY51457.1 1-phosphatidylinositol-4-phosphate 5-kinase Its3 [Schizosaccharomyces cryophilus OY26]
MKIDSNNFIPSKSIPKETVSTHEEKPETLIRGEKHSASNSSHSQFGDQAEGKILSRSSLDCPPKIADMHSLQLFTETKVFEDSTEPSVPQTATSTSSFSYDSPSSFDAGALESNIAASAEATSPKNPAPQTTDHRSTLPNRRLHPETPSSRNDSGAKRSDDRKASLSNSALDEIPPDIGSASWAEAVKQKRLNMRRRREELDDDCVLVGTRVSEGHENYVTAYNMLTGIRVGVSRCQAKMDRALTPADFTARHKYTFDITGNELTPSARYDFKFKDYAPWVFRHLRQLFHLDAADYLVSLTSKYILSELDSPGKSGSFFYFSRDYRFIIKTIHRSEHKFLREILYDYYEHVKNNPNTLISQFYGLHRVKLPFGRKIHFVVMNNLFPPHRDIHQTFDLKGSTLGRELNEDLPSQNPMCTMKDSNWLRRDMHLQFGPLKRQIFLTQVKADIDLLSSLGIMDYSLLVGIHDLTRGNRDKIRNSILSVYDPNVSQHQVPSAGVGESNAHVLRQVVNSTGPVSLDRSCNRLPSNQFMERSNFMFYSDDGGFQATNENNQPANHIFYIGIIDLLTKYSYVKKAEHLWKGINHSESAISAVPPAEYANRFYKFIESGIKPDHLTLKPIPMFKHQNDNVVLVSNHQNGNDINKTDDSPTKPKSKIGDGNLNSEQSPLPKKSSAPIQMASASPKRFPFIRTNVTGNSLSPSK